MNKNIQEGFKMYYVEYVEDNRNRSTEMFFSFDEVSDKEEELQKNPDVTDCRIIEQ